MEEYFNTNLAKLISVDFRKSEFLNINISNWYKASVYFSMQYRYLDFIRPIRMVWYNFKHDRS